MITCGIAAGVESGFTQGALKICHFFSFNGTANAQLINCYLNFTVLQAAIRPLKKPHLSNSQKIIFTHHLKNTLIFHIVCSDYKLFAAVRCTYMLLLVTDNL